MIKPGTPAELAAVAAARRVVAASPGDQWTACEAAAIIRGGPVRDRLLEQPPSWLMRELELATAPI
ncbi:hypothetical protein [Jiangella mangrovi]|uniref:Uncharacterized protein n=1 Tax=Jiangella mangrovi TaxID=1524084 RepID=A0A7W9LPZ3_9ACTN|nr:hypothetical protein [Jiangella mangrovi]MBB5791786.1 hypothetical protein [Jiangella mangrovi]